MARLFTVNRVPVTLESVAHESELRRGENRVKIAVLTLKIPLSRQLAAAMPDGVLRRLYQQRNDDVDPMVLRVDFASLVDRQVLTVAAAPDSGDDSCALDQVRIYAVRAQRPPTSNTFVLTCRASFGPLSAAEWAFIDFWRGTQRFVSFKAAQQSLEFQLEEKDTDAGDEDDDDSQPALKAVNGTCAHGCRVGEACQECPDNLAQPVDDVEDKAEPVNRKLHSHQAKKKNGTRGRR